MSGPEHTKSLIEKERLPAALRTVLRHTRDMIVCMDFNFTILEVSQAAVDYYAWDYDRIVGYSYIKLAEEYGVKTSMPELAPRLQAGETFCDVETVINVKGKEKYASWRIDSLTEDSGECFAYILIGTESTRERMLQKQSLRDQTHLETVVSCMPGFVYWKDCEGKFLGANDLFARFLGFDDANDLIGRYDVDLFTGEALTNIRQHDEEVLRSQQLVIKEEVLNNQEGNEVIIQSYKVPLVFEKEIEGVLGISMDITDAKRAEYRLTSTVNRMVKAEMEAQNAKTYLENIIASVPAGLCWKNQDGRYLGCNQEFVLMSGFKSRDDIVGKTDEECSRGEKSWKKRLEQIRMTDQKAMETQDCIEYEFEVELGGTEKTILAKKRPLLDDHGRVLGVLGSAVDITVQKRSERAANLRSLRAEKKRKEVSGYLRNILRVVPVMVTWKDLEGTHIGCSDYTLKLLNLDNMDQLLGHKDPELPWVDEPEKVLEQDAYVIKTGSSITYETSFTVPTKGKIDVLVHKVPLKNDEGGVVGVIGISTDISVRKKVEAEVQRARELAEMENQAKSDFLAAISHDFRTPLNAIIGFSQLLQWKSNLTKQDQKEYVQGIERSGQQLLKFIDRILEYSQLEMHGASTKVKCFNLEKKIEEVVSLVAASVEPKKREQVRLVLKQEAGLNCEVEGDDESLGRVIINLVSNAFRFTHQGEIAVTARMEWVDYQNITLFVSVKDTGIGIPNDKIEFIFGKFSRLEPSYKGGDGGVGLGLAICKQLVSDLGGTIGVNNTGAAGTEFWFTLPFKLAKKD